MWGLWVSIGMEKVLIWVCKERRKKKRVNFLDVHGLCGW